MQSMNYIAILPERFELHLPSGPPPLNLAHQLHSLHNSNDNLTLLLVLWLTEGICPDCLKGGSTLLFPPSLMVHMSLPSAEQTEVISPSSLLFFLLVLYPFTGTPIYEDPVNFC